ncbi:tryptophan--tRNA ligase [Jeongeupia sp. HS-3]|uniref:hypothetical protein n=1 Tax=Jeongeupia sp. HS-3 TaxID=1009682 RepID=UPI0018A5EB15|nr:hypothetical protein [Jeongeupia sp. HS-3]BCL76208.1 tryptophan--tRNA ligase [Jeongeupia sp. HS-3]
MTEPRNPVTILLGNPAQHAITVGNTLATLNRRLPFLERHRPFLMLDDGAPLDTVIDHLAVGIDAEQCTIFVASQVPELAEIGRCVAPLLPASQTATAMTAIRPALAALPQSAHLGEANRIARHCNSLAGRELFPEALALPETRRTLLPLGHEVRLTSSPAELRAAVLTMALPTQKLAVEHHPLFAYLDAFESDIYFLDDLKAKFRRGGLADDVLQLHLAHCLEAFVAPLRQRRAELAQQSDSIAKQLQQGIAHTRAIAAQTLLDVRHALA